MKVNNNGYWTNLQLLELNSTSQLAQNKPDRK